MFAPVGVLVLILINFTRFFCCENVPCPLSLSVDISDGVKSGLNIVKQNLTYTPELYFEHEGTTRGCVCELKRCIWKCCPEGQLHMDEECINDTSAFTFNVYDKTELVKVENDYFYFMYPYECNNSFALDPYSNVEQMYLQKSGELYLPNDEDSIYRFDEFCLDLFKYDDVVVFSARVCYTEKEVEKKSREHLNFGMIISMPFLLVTFIVYALIPERNLPAKALMCYVLSLLFAYIFLVTIQLHSSFEPFACATVGLLCYFFFMVSFFWMNSSCIDIWLTFSGIRGLTGSKKRDTRRFLYYSAYAWGVPFLLVCLVIGLSYGPSVDVKSLYHPGLGNGQCWFGSGMPTFLYFYLPIAILLTTNIVLFCVTAYKIQMVRNDTAMLRRDDSQKSRLESDKQRFNLYVKLLLAMGINWTMEVISWALNWKFSNIPDEVWYLTDFCNALYGVFIFFIFVFKRNIWIMLKKRYLTFTGKPHLAHSLGTSTTRTTVSHVTSEA